MVKDEQAARTDILKKGDSYIEGLRILHRKDGVQDWVLRASRADIDPSGDEASLSGVTVAFSDRGVTVQAEKGLFRMKDRQLKVDGRITASGEGFSVTSQGAVINSTSGSILTGGPVVIEGKRFRVQGRGMQADESGQTVRILNDVTAVFNN